MPALSTVYAGGNVGAGVVVVHRQANLLEVVDALRPRGTLGAQATVAAEIRFPSIHDDGDPIALRSTLGRRQAWRNQVRRVSLGDLAQILKDVLSQLVQGLGRRGTLALDDEPETWLGILS